MEFGQNRSRRASTLDVLDEEGLVGVSVESAPAGVRSRATDGSVEAAREQVAGSAASAESLQNPSLEQRADSSCQVGRDFLLAVHEIEIARLRSDEQVFHDVLGWRGTRVPVTARVVDLSDRRDAGLRALLARAKRAFAAVR